MLYVLLYKDQFDSLRWYSPKPKSDIKKWRKTLYRRADFRMRMETKHCLENQIFFFQTFWKDSLSKKTALEYDLSCDHIFGKTKYRLSREYNVLSER